MNVSSWLWNWLDAPPQQPSSDFFDHAAKLSLRKLEDRQVLSVSAVFSAGLLNIDLTGGDDVSLQAISGDVWESINGGAYQQLDGNSGMAGITSWQYTVRHVDTMLKSKPNVWWRANA